MTMRSLIDRLKERPKTAEADVEQKRAEWLKAVGSLFATVEHWISPAVAEGVLRIDRSTEEIEDPDLGAYLAPILRISDDRTTVRLAVAGARVVGMIGHPGLQFRGRVDLVSGPIKVPLVRGMGDSWKALPLRGDPVDLNAEAFSELLSDILLDD